MFYSDLEKKGKNVKFILADRFGNLTILDNGASDKSENDDNDEEEDDYNSNDENSEGNFYCDDIHIYHEGK